MQIIHGVITEVGALGVMRVRRLGGGLLNVICPDGFRVGDKVVLIFDPIRAMITEVYSLAEWERNRTDECAEEPFPGKEEEDMSEPYVPEDDFMLPEPITNGKSGFDDNERDATFHLDDDGWWE